MINCLGCANLDAEVTRLRVENTKLVERVAELECIERAARSALVFHEHCEFVGPPESRMQHHAHVIVLGMVLHGIGPDNKKA